MVLRPRPVRRVRLCRTFFFSFCRAKGRESSSPAFTCEGEESASGLGGFAAGRVEQADNQIGCSTWNIVLHCKINGLGVGAVGFVGIVPRAARADGPAARLNRASPALEKRRQKEVQRSRTRRTGSSARRPPPRRPRFRRVCELRLRLSRSRLQRGRGKFGPNGLGGPAGRSRRGICA